MITAKMIIDRALSYLYTYYDGTDKVKGNEFYCSKQTAGISYQWCADFLWCIFNECGASEIFYNGNYTADCPAVFDWGRNKNLLVGISEGQYGDIVLFDRNGDGIANHMGFIISRNGNGTYETVEGDKSVYNYTNDGYVIKMTRYYISIIAIIRPNYGDSKKTD